MRPPVVEQRVICIGPGKYPVPIPFDDIEGVWACKFVGGKISLVEPQVVREADGAAGDRQRCHQDDLEDEQERHQTTEPEGLEGLPEVEIGAAAAWQRRAELRVDEAIGQREDRSHHPCAGRSSQRS